MDFAANRSTWGGKSSAEASQQRTVSVGVEVSSAPQKGAGSIVWLLPSLRSL